jgi:hypothetical protein
MTSVPYTGSVKISNLAYCTCTIAYVASTSKSVNKKQSDSQTIFSKYKVISSRSESTMQFLRLSVKTVALLIVVVLLHFISIDCFTHLSSSHSRVMTPLSQGRNDIVTNISRQKENDIEFKDSWKVAHLRQTTVNVIATCFISLLVLVPPSIVWADGQTKEFKFPPIDYSDKSRCVLEGGSSMGQANAARDKLYDLRQCKLSGVDASGYDLSGVSKFYIIFTLLYCSNYLYTYFDIDA